MPRLRPTRGGLPAKNALSLGGLSEIWICGRCPKLVKRCTIMYCTFVKSKKGTVVWSARI
jgi:hypothetical protein